MKFCPRCGKRTGLIEGFCNDCYNQAHKLTIKNINIKICSYCRKYQLKNKWIKYSSIKDAVKDAIKKKIKDKCAVFMSIPEHKPNPGVNADGEAEVHIKLNKYKIQFRLSFTLCQKCGKAGTTYFEGILQLRNPDKDIVWFVENDVAKHNYKGVFINKKEEVRNGIDYYLTSNTYLKSLGKKLKRQFKGELAISARLFTRNKQTSKDVYRMSVLFRMD